MKNYNLHNSFLVLCRIAKAQNSLDFNTVNDGLNLKNPCTIGWQRNLNDIIREQLKLTMNN